MIPKSKRCVFSDKFHRRFVLRWVAVFSSLVLLCWGTVGDAAEDGKLYLIGVGPGDADMMTIRAARIIEKADIVYVSPGVAQRLQEYLTGKEVVEGYWNLFQYYGAHRDAILEDKLEVYDQISRRREELIRQIRRQVAQGKVVAVLDNGDPLIYGPWAWILEEFADLNPEVVPGISAFNAAHAALRKSPTISPRTKSVILTANDWPGKTDKIAELARLGVPMAIFTMRAEFEEFVAKLRHALPHTTPVAVVEHAGYREKERVVLGTLQDITQKVSGKDLAFEYLLYVGDFITYRQKCQGH